MSEESHLDEHCPQHGSNWDSQCSGCDKAMDLYVKRKRAEIAAKREAQEMQVKGVDY